MEQSVAIDPDLSQPSVSPVWWNRKGFKMKLVSVTDAAVIIAGPAARLIIGQNHHQVGFAWRIDRQLDVFLVGDTSGAINLKTDELLAAFGITDNCQSYAPEATKFIKLQRQASAASAGKFIRAGRYLSLPDAVELTTIPDHNVSVYLTDEIITAVRNLVADQALTVGFG